MKPPLSILLIDDDPDVGEFVAAAAEGLDIPCVITTDPSEFLQALRPEVTLVFLDLVMPQLDGIELLRLISQQQHKPDIILMSGIGKRIIEAARRLGESLGLQIVAELGKPFRLAELEATLRNQMNRAEDPGPRQKTHLELTDDEIRHAIVRNEFVLHYQPQVRISDGQLIGIEALVRWQHPQRGLIFPDDFIPAMERLNLIDNLGWTVATIALADQARLGADLTISINVSAQSLRDLSLPDRIVELAHQCGAPPHRLILEITESGLIKELSTALDVLTRLRMKNIQLSIDDFGTGYSMLQQLRLVPANELKIDRSFVQCAQTSESDRVMVLKTIEIGHELGMTVIAEGVETAAQLAFLKEHGCDSAQGYYFSRPIPQHELMRWIANYRPF